MSNTMCYNGSILASNTTSVTGSMIGRQQYIAIRKYRDTVLDNIPYCIGGIWFAVLQYGHLIGLVFKNTCQGYLYFGSGEKYFIVSYGMLIHYMSTCDISNNERINISIFENCITKFHELPEQPS